MVNLAPFPVIPPQPPAVPGLEPADFRLFDVLNCCALAVDEAESGRRDPAEAAHAAAREAASLLPAGGAVAVILAASAPDRGPENRAALWHALTAASLAVLVGQDGRRPALLARVLPEARSAASLLPADWRNALKAILAGACPEAGATA